MEFTRREKHVAVIMLLFLLGVLAFGNRLPDNDIYEYLVLIFVVAPVGFYIATDPERLNKNSPIHGEDESR
jgi:hypothetical protein